MNTLSKKLRVALGDGTMDISSEFLINAYNYAVNALPMVPQLDKLFSKHKYFNLDAKNHYKWSMSDATGFRMITDFPLFKFYTSTGGEPCELCICRKSVKDFYEKNGIIELKQPGQPCEYTIETEGDNVWLVLDRPSDVPIIVNYIAYGVPRPVHSMDDEVEVSAIAENLIIDVMKTLWYQESSDFAFASDIRSYLDNKTYLEAIQQLHKRWDDEGPRVLGEV